MRLARHIALMLAVAIVAVAAGLMPSDARAHGGHGPGLHERAATHAATHAVPAAKAVAAAVEHAAELTATGQAHAACPGCAVCGHAPSSCCATGLSPSAVPALPAPPLAGLAPARDGPPLAGIVPEARTKPPKPFA